MIETQNPEIDVDRLMEEIRAEVMRAPAEGAAADGAGLAGDPGWFALHDELNVAAQHAAVGREVPAFSRFGAPVRRLARLAARAVLYVGELVTHHQRIYNEAALSALRQLAERVRELEGEVAALRARLGESEAGRRGGADAGPLG